MNLCNGEKGCLKHINVSNRFFFISKTNRKLVVMYAYRCTPSNSIRYIYSVILRCPVLFVTWHGMRWEAAT